MVEEEHHGVTVDVCACGAIWLDGGEIEELIRKRLRGAEEPSRPNNRDDDFWPLDVVLEVVASFVDW
jgi:Zn-finger nucleic acid-binding protein